MYTLSKVRDYCKCLLLLDMQLKKGRVQMFVATRNATYKRSSSNVFETPFVRVESLLR